MAHPDLAQERFLERPSPAMIVVAGTASNVGKTTLVCDLLLILPGWEAIKLTRGHYRSCGKHPEACCVSHLLSSEPTVYSDPISTRVPDKDTDRFWRAGASAVHWVVAKSDHVEQGIREALSRVRAPGVVIEATSALAFLEPAYSILVASQPEGEVKPSARRALKSGRIDCVYFPLEDEPSVGGQFVGMRTFSAGSKAALFKTVMALTECTRR